MVVRTSLVPTTQGAEGTYGDSPTLPEVDYALLGRRGQPDPASGSDRQTLPLVPPSIRPPGGDAGLALCVGLDLGRLYRDIALDWIRSQSLQLSSRGTGDSTEAFVERVIASLSPDQRERLDRVKALADRYPRVLELLG